MKSCPTFILFVLLAGCSDTNRVQFIDAEPIPARQPAPIATSQPAASPATVASPATQPAREALPDETQKLVDELVAYECSGNCAGSRQRVFFDDHNAITGIWLNSQWTTRQNVKALSSLHDLTAIKLRCPCEHIIADDLAHLGQLKNLRVLELCGIGLIDRQYCKAISTIQNLDTLVISYGGITPDALAELGPLNHLRSLKIDGRSFNDNSVSSILKLDHLVYLDMSFTDVSNASLNELSSLPRLKYLRVSSTAITEAGFKASKLYRRVIIIGAKQHDSAEVD